MFWPSKHSRKLSPDPDRKFTLTRRLLVVLLSLSLWVSAAATLAPPTLVRPPAVLPGLPVVALLMGSGAGAAPWRFLLATPPGVVCLGLGLACGLVGLAWIERLAGAVEAGAT